ncbi:MAG: SDR family NAD(P)-dependent oxidoreductase [Candidatus Latescibacterota bacterium]|nr:SDR family NAD(P)-dependent oxidoreductase [Candidatus Latescibacterota bacterium]
MPTFLHEEAKGELVELAGKVAVVTGGNGGLGRRICLALARANCDVAVIYNKEEEREMADRVADALRELGSKAAVFHCELRDVHSVRAMVASVIERFGGVDILVNDAAYNKWIPFDDLDALTFDEWDRIIDTNLTGPMRCIKAVVPSMRARGGGRIVNIASVAGLSPTGSSIPYAVSKAGLIHLTKCTALGLAPDILVNCVAPGFIEGTQVSDNLTPEYKKSMTESVALKKPADKDEIAKQVVAFCEGDTTTGQTLVNDSGRIWH